MGTRIDTVAATRSRRGPFAEGALALADRAATLCLERAGRGPRELDLLINAGVYREENLAEPAFAALIQHSIGAYPSATPWEGRGTFSFDVSNGGSGVLTGIHLLDGFVQAGAVRLGMVVASDADPSPGASRGFRFPGAGGALLLTAAENGEGFADFHFESFPEFEDLFVSRVSWKHQRKGWRWVGQHIMEVEEKDDYSARCLDCAETAIERFLHRLGLRAGDLDLFILSEQPRGFADGLAERLSVPMERIARVAPDFRGAHTAGPLAALEVAMDDGRFQAAENTLFATVSSGITVALALYRR